MLVRAALLGLAIAVAFGLVACAPTRPQHAPLFVTPARAAKARPPAPPHSSKVAEGEPDDAPSVVPADARTEPVGDDVPWEEGLVSFYADSLAGNRTASGERYSPEEGTCAHRSHPFGTMLEVQVKRTGRTARCRVNDRGPWVQGRILDVSRKIARDLDLVHHGVLEVRVRPAPQ